MWASSQRGDLPVGQFPTAALGLQGYRGPRRAWLGAAGAAVAAAAAAAAEEAREGEGEREDGDREVCNRAG